MISTIKCLSTFQESVRKCLKHLFYCTIRTYSVSNVQLKFKSINNINVDLTPQITYSIINNGANAWNSYTLRNYSGSSMSANELFRHLDYNQLIEQKENKSNIVIDVREKHELDSTGVIPGAYHIPLGEIETAFKTPPEEFKQKYNFKKPGTDDHIIFSCRSGKRSLVALEAALGQGFKYAKHYTGGWLDWEKNSSEPK